MPLKSHYAKIKYWISNLKDTINGIKIKSWTFSMKLEQSFMDFLNFWHPAFLSRIFDSIINDVDGKKHHTVYTLSNFRASSFLKRSQGDLFFAFAGVSCQSHLWHTKKRRKLKIKRIKSFSTYSDFLLIHKWGGKVYIPSENLFHSTGDKSTW